MIEPTPAYKAGWEAAQVAWNHGLSPSEKCPHGSETPREYKEGYNDFLEMLQDELDQQFLEEGDDMTYICYMGPEDEIEDEGPDTIEEDSPDEEGRK